MTDDISIPKEFIPTDHVVIRGDADSYRDELEIAATEDGRGVVILGVSPPFYAPAVFKTEEHRYRIEQAGHPKAHANLENKACTCDNRKNWCSHLRWSALVASRVKK
jgi:hypothetical protein